MVVGGAVLMLVLGIGAGLWLVLTGGDDADPAEEAPSVVDQAAWSAAASEVCGRVANDYPVLTSGADELLAPANVATVEEGMRELTTDIRALTMPTAAEDAAAVAETIQIGDLADRAWAAALLESASDEGVAEAAAIAEAYIAALNDLGADCSALS